MPKGIPKSGINKGWFKKGQIPWCAGTKGKVKGYWKGKKRYYKNPKKRKLKISKTCKEKGVGKWMKGRKFSLEIRKKLSESHKGDKTHLWKGGIDKENNHIRKSFEYKLWRESVFTRDKWTCQFCGKKNCYLEAHHIKPFALFPELRFAIDNGRTLCKECHNKTYELN